MKRRGFLASLLAAAGYRDKHMALPAILDSTFDLWFPQYAHPAGPYSYGGKLYAALTSFGDSSLQVWMSSDGGETWAECDAGNHPNPEPAWSLPRSMAVYGGKIYYAAWWNLGLRMDAFDLASETWDAPTAYSAYSVNTVGPYNPFQLRLVYRPSTSEWLIFFRHSDETVSGTPYQRIYWQKYSVASGWSGLTMLGSGLAEHHSLGSALLGSSDMIHVFLQTGTTLKHVSVDTSDVSGTVQTIATDLEEAASTTQGIVLGTPSLFGSQLALPYARKIGAVEDFAVAIADDSALADPAWSVEQVSTMAPDCTSTANVFSSAVFAIGSNLAAAWVTPDRPDSKNIYYALRSGPWQTPILIRTSPYKISNLQAAHLGSGLVGVLYGYGEDSSSGGVYYNQYQAALFGCRYRPLF